MSSLQGILGNPAAASMTEDAQIDNMLGQAGVANPQDRRALIRTIKEGSVVKLAQFMSATAKDVAIRMHLFSKNVQNRYASGDVVTRPIALQFRAKVVDDGGATKIVFVESGHTKAKGWRDAAPEGLPSGYPFIVRQIQLKAGIQATPTEKADVETMKAEFQSIALKPIDHTTLASSISKGKLFIKSGSQDQFMDGLGMNSFIDTPIHLRTGLYELETPITFQDKVSLEIFVETFGKVPQGTFFELTLLGGGPQPTISSNSKED